MRLVDHHGHALLAVARLTAVDPDRVGVVDEDGVGRRARVECDGHEAGLDARDVGHDVVDGHARVVEGGLRCGVVLHVVELVG